MRDSRPRQYHDVVDDLVHACRAGQGTVGPDRVRRGVWNPHVTELAAPDQHAMNLLLARLSATDRETLATFLAQEFEAGVHETLKVLEKFKVAPFEAGYEGSPYHDFIGRLTGVWEWPDHSR